jgi:site-specific DNA-methyltransferase (adenine-specific)
MTTRQQDLETITSAIRPQLIFASDNVAVGQGDSLALLRSIPQHSVSLILTDPPYHSTKKDNIYGDTAFAEDQHYIDWMSEYAVEWRRVLKPNGSLFCFCASSMSARLEVMLSQRFNVLSHIVWAKPNDPGFDGWKGKMKKEALRQWYAHSERILFAEPAIDGNLFRSPFAEMLSNYRKQAGLSMHELTAITGAHGKVNHGGAVSNWEAGRNTPSRDQYEKIRTAILATGKVQFMPIYEDAIRVFTMDASKEFTDVWNFPSVRPYKSKHPAEKPADMLEHIIGATTYPGDIVLDSFGGSGSTALAALRLGRRTVSIEIESKWAAEIAARVQAVCEANNEVILVTPPTKRSTLLHRQLPKREVPQISLFEFGSK